MRAALLCALLLVPMALITSPALAQSKAIPVAAPASARNVTLEQVCLDGYVFVVLKNKAGAPLSVTQFMEYRGQTYPKACGERTQ